MSGWLTALGPEGTALALLLTGHVLGDFVFQTDELAEKKHQWTPLLTHTGIVFVVHLVVFIPLLTPRTGLLVLSVGVSHFLIDAVTARVRRRKGTSALLFPVDQIAHLLILFVGWSLIGSEVWTDALVVSSLGGSDSLPWSVMTTGAIYLSAFIFAHEGGNTIVQGVLPDDGPESEGEDLEAGSLIGTLERWIVLLLGIVGLWESIALVVAVKSIARFQELKQRAFAEYFLVGTLTSVLVAIVLVVLVSALV